MESKKVILTIFGIILLVASINLVSAEFWACFEDGDEVDFCNPNIDDRECDSDLCKYCMKEYDSENGCFSPGSYNKCNSGNGCSFFGGDGSIDSDPPEMTINSPLNDSLHTEREVLVDIELNEDSEIEYMDLLDGRERWNRLCRGCDSYDKEVSFEEGFNSIRFRATDDNGNEAFMDVEFFVDISDPKIKGTEPTRGFASGDFFVEFDEDNPALLNLNYGNDFVGWRFMEVDIDNECLMDRNYECNTYVDLSDYDGQEIEYWFNLTDIVGNYDESMEEELDVDVSFPVINSLDYEIDGKYVVFEINITEVNLDEITYIDTLDDRAREKDLCRNVDEGICRSDIRFGDGEHGVRISVADEAGNVISSELIEFFVDSKDPRIRSTDPTRGFASGDFFVEFDEDNPALLNLNYGNDLTGFRNSKVDIDNDCVVDRNYECNTYVDLSDYDGQEIEYWFNLTDISGNFDESRERELDVDISFPIINDISFEVDGSRVEFILNITESNLDEVEYIDNSDSRPRWKRMCSRLKNDLCEKRIRLRGEGEHDIGFQIIDEAGNMVSTNIIVNI